MEQLAREVEVLKAQNLSLRKSEGEAREASRDRDAGARGQEETKNGGRVLGSAADGSTGPAGEGELGGVREQQHSKWEKEKKNEKRLLVLEKRLQEKIEENDSLKQQVLMQQRYVFSFPFLFFLFFSFHLFISNLLFTLSLSFPFPFLFPFPFFPLSFPFLSLFFPLSFPFLSPFFRLSSS